ncbi:MAG: hypothetical protein L6V93_06585 [Clostridiales bacterium]|nr:MAG: hypothetical protein L6V93_06585 [Clostridiales bacterium]
MFAYRTSAFCDDDIIIKSYIKLNRKNADEIRAEMLDLNARRKEKNNRLTTRAPEAPLSAPRDILRQKLIDDCGLRGKKA